jgi:acyl-CoA reductase-like NAD-dependent aldehyde dehydrogenase
MLYAAALHDAGAPPGVVNVVNGDADAMGRRLLSEVRVRKVAFTGSSAVGRSLIEASGQHVTRLALELGGNAPVIVFPDVEDLDKVASSGVTAKLRNCGQACIAPQRYYVHSTIVEEFTSKVAKHFEQQKVGNGLDPDVTVGPLINAKQRGWVAGLVEQSAHAGARVRTGGDSVSGPGYFYQPTVLDQVPPDAPILTEEVFGPVMPIVPFDTTEEALAMANASEYGLAAFVCTGNLRTALRVSEQLEYGLVGINDWYPVSAEAPFGGMRQSGIGRESGYEGVHEYVEAKARFFGGIE